MYISFPALVLNIVNWAVLSDEQMRKRWQFSPLNDEQMVATRWGLSTNQLKSMCARCYFRRCCMLIHDTTRIVMPDIVQNYTRKKSSKKITQMVYFGVGSQMSSDPNPAYLLYIGDYTTQIYRDYN